MKFLIQAEEKNLHSEETQQEIRAERGRLSGCIAMVLTILYAGYILHYFGGVGIDSLGGFLANAIVMPHMVCVTVAAIFSAIGFFGRKRWAMLVSGILMAVSGVLMMQYLQMVILQAILLIVSYARMEA